MHAFSQELFEMETVLSLRERVPKARPAADAGLAQFEDMVAFPYDTQVSGHGLACEHVRMHMWLLLSLYCP